MSIASIETEIDTLVSEITDIKETYTYPVFRLSRRLPALMIIYDGIDQDYEAVQQTETKYRYEFTLYFPAEGRNLESNWADLKSTAIKVLNKFRNNPTLNNIVLQSIIRTGRTIIDVDQERPKWIGHSFVLEAVKIET